MKNHKFEINVEGTKLMIEDKSHAGIFRQFWAHFITTDLIKTIESIEIAGIRTSEQPNFIAKNGQKKKNIPVTEHLFVYGHLTPAAMLKTYEKFQDAWDGKIVAPLDDVTAQPETNDDLSVINQQIDQEIEMLNADNESKELNEQQEEILTKTADAITKDSLSQEEYGVDFEDLIPTQKGKITKAYNKLIAESQEETQEEMDLPQM